MIGGRDQEQVEFLLHDGDYATSSLERWAYPHRWSTVQAPAITLDRLCTDWPRLDLVKIDAEGAEALVWEGDAGDLEAVSARRCRDRIAPPARPPTSCQLLAPT